MKSTSSPSRPKSKMPSCWSSRKSSRRARLVSGRGVEGKEWEEGRGRVGMGRWKGGGRRGKRGNGRGKGGRGKGEEREWKGKRGRKAEEASEMARYMSETFRTCLFLCFLGNGRTKTGKREIGRVPEEKFSSEAEGAASGEGGFRPCAWEHTQCQMVETADWQLLGLQASLEEMRWRELEETQEKAAKLRGEGLRSRNSAGVKPVTALRLVPSV